MKFSFRTIQSYIYIFMAAVSIVFFVIVFNNLLIGNQALIKSGLSLASTGNWMYWIFIASLIGVIIFIYLYLKFLSDAKKFTDIISGSSKQNFIKNLKDLEQIAYKLGPAFEEKLREAKSRWNYKG
jgi:hypothetical protein